MRHLNSRPQSTSSTGDPPTARPAAPASPAGPEGSRSAPDTNRPGCTHPQIEQQRHPNAQPSVDSRARMQAMASLLAQGACRAANRHNRPDRT